MPRPNFKNRTLWTGDNLDVMRGLNSETVDLIYLDPPFNSKKNYSAPIGSEAAGAAFKGRAPIRSDRVDVPVYSRKRPDNRPNSKKVRLSSVRARIIIAAPKKNGNYMQSLPTALDKPPVGVPRS